VIRTDSPSNNVSALFGALQDEEPVTRGLYQHFSDAIGCAFFNKFCHPTHSSGLENLWPMDALVTAHALARSSQKE
jgi:hypothetical protein